MQYASIFMIMILSFSALSVPIFAQQDATPSASPPAAPLITTSIDKTSYTLGDTIVISGQVQSVVVGTPLVIQIFDPNNSLVQVAQIDVSEDGKYTDTIKAVGPYWKLNGVYTIKVQYGPPNVTAQSTFTFQSTPTTISDVFQLKDPGSQQTFNVNYTISGGSVKTMTIDAQSLSVIASINSTSDGTITLQLPRALIDSKTTSGQDDAFIILIDGAEVKPQSESANNDFRNITVQFLQGDQDIEIIGTQIVPEFGPIAALVLAIAIVSIIAVSAKTGLRFMPKY
ncbi:MAG TPA: PEFG-CTERM sorting domain-containing protein [Candidatus Nitrosotalea sp.]|nr:PEFG-CTERM sorting domain-containing protein [Candidatus Nitrosotalea sp.]